MLICMFGPFYNRKPPEGGTPNGSDFREGHFDGVGGGAAVGGIVEQSDGGGAGAGLLLVIGTDLCEGVAGEVGVFEENGNGSAGGACAVDAVDRAGGGK